MALTYNPAGAPSVRDTTPPRPPDRPGEFSRFEDLTRKLVQVPKAELDEKRKEGKS